MSEAKSLRKLDNSLDKAYTAVYEADELIKLQITIRCRCDEPSESFGPSNMMISDRVEIARHSLNKAIKHYRELLDPAIGRLTKDDYIKAWGPPQSTTAVSDGEVCVWLLSYGSRSIGQGSQPSLYSSTYHFHQQSSHEMYDKLTLSFNTGGFLQTWRAYCQR